MTLNSEYLTYPMRRYGMDHDRYEWSDMFDRESVVLPNNAKIALWVMPILQWFPLVHEEAPFKAPGALTMPYPDLRHYTVRDYGNRIGIFRLLNMMKELGIKGSVAMNSRVVERYPELAEHLLQYDVEWIAHGRDMGAVHYTGMTGEKELIEKTLTTLRKFSGQDVKGWLSPGRAQSEETMDILAANKVLYNCDWANDDLPYVMRVKEGQHYSMPMAYETDDRVVQLEFFHSADEWAVQVKDRFDLLMDEAQSHGARILSIPLHAWVSGVPYRSLAVREVLEYIVEHSGVWIANGVEILDAFIKPRVSR